MLGKIDTQSAVAAAGITATSSVFGAYAPIVVAAVFGALIALSRSQLPSWQQAVLFLFRAVSIAAGTTMLAVKALVAATAYDASDLVIPVAGLIALVGDDWFRLKDAAIARVTAIIGRVKE